MDKETFETIDPILGDIASPFNGIGYGPRKQRSPLSEGGLV
jgi:hypothetical protein